MAAQPVTGQIRRLRDIRLGPSRCPEDRTGNTRRRRI